jgi:hypothetical protein
MGYAMNKIGGVNMETDTAKSAPRILTLEEGAKRGWYIFPCTGKVPLVSWRKESTTDLAKISEWKRRFPNCNWGIDCGKSGLTVFDNDCGKHPIEAEDSLFKMELENGPLPPTFKVGTPSGGYHQHYSGEGCNSASDRLGKGLDSRGKGGFVIGPFSPGYEIIEDLPIAEAPQWFLDLTGKQIEREPTLLRADVELDTEGNIKRAADFLRSARPAIEGEGGDNWTFKIACQIKDFGISPEKAFDLMSEWNCENLPPWNPEDLQKKIANAFRHGKNTPGCSDPSAVFSKFEDPAQSTKNSGDSNVITNDSTRLSSLIIDLADPSPVELPEDVVEKIIPGGEATLLAGHGGSGKSYVALLIAILVATGRGFGSLRTARRAVIFYSAEDPATVLRHRVGKICGAFGIDQPQLAGWLHLIDVSEHNAALSDTQGGLSRMAQVLGDLTRKLSAGLVIIDNVSDVFEGKEIDRQMVRRFVRGLRNTLARPNRGLLLLAHISKGAATSRKIIDEDYSGSTAWHNSCRSRLSLTEKDGALVLKQMKANHGAKAHDVRLLWTDSVPIPQGPFDDEWDEEASPDNRQMKRDQHKATIARIIDNLAQAGEHVPASTVGRCTTYSYIKGHQDYPVALSKTDCDNLVREMLTSGILTREHARTQGRKDKVVIRLKPDQRPN